jgi:hypothetical protein
MGMMAHKNALDDPVVVSVSTGFYFPTRERVNNKPYIPLY